MFWKTPKSFMGGGGWVGGWVVCCNYSVYSGPDLLNLRLRLNWRGPVRHLKLTWRWSGPEFDNNETEAGGTRHVLEILEMQS